MKTAKISVFVVLVAACFLALWGCPKKVELSSIPEAQKIEPAPVAESETKPETKPEMKPEMKQEPAERAGASLAGLQSVYYDFDSSSIREDASAVMQANAQWLKANPAVSIRIEGNCDDRGTREYNQALGQQRAQSAKRYLTDLGILSSRIALISYGMEKPVCATLTEDCRAKNRRGDFIAASE